MSKPFKIHTSVAGAQTIKAVGDVVVSATWKETKNQTRKERAVIVPMECVKAPEVPESFRALVESVLMSSAESVLKAHVNSEPNSYEILSSVFDRPNLVESFLSSGSGWMSREELESGWNASATWQRIVSREEFKSNKTYQNTALRLKDTILKLSGKASQIPPEICDAILAKLEPSDLETEFGCFVVRRLDSIRQKSADAFDLSAL